MKLYELPWGPYPRRVTIYLTEKGILNVERIAVDVMSDWKTPAILALSPAGTLPILDVGDGTAIGSSVAILEYLEERFPSPNMIGETAAERAVTRDLMNVIDDLTHAMANWTRCGSPLMAAYAPQSAEAAAFAATGYAKKLKLLDMLVRGEFLAGSSVTIADCMAMAVLQNADGLHGVPIPADCPALAAWYDRFSKRPSAAPATYPAPLLELAFGGLTGKMKASGAHV